MLADLHVHMLLDGENYKSACQRHKAAPDDAWIRECLAAYREKGITFLRDGGDRFGVSLRARALAWEYGIDYRSPAFPIHKRGHYGSVVGRAYSDHKEYLALLDEAERQRADFIKLMVSGLIDFSAEGRLTEAALPPEEIRFLVDAAHDRGFAVMVHANGDDAVLGAAAAGVESVEHGAFLSEDCLLLLADRGILWIPTLATIGNLIGCGRYPDEILRPLLKKQQEKVSFAAAAGGQIGLGSDAGAHRVRHGEGAEEEYLYLRQALGAQTDAMLLRSEGIVRKRFLHNACP